jgi:hypothetical protein
MPCSQSPRQHRVEYHRHHFTNLLAFETDCLYHVLNMNGKELEWSLAFARMTSRACEVRREDKVVWSVARTMREVPTDTYYNVVQRYLGPSAKGDSKPDKDK